MDVGDVETLGTNRADMPNTKHPTKHPECSKKRRIEQNKGSEWPTVSKYFSFKFY